MFIYETEGFLEVESKQIQQLCRSTAPVSLDDAEPETYAVHAVLCDYLDNSEQRCCVAFYSKVLKRSLVFAVGEAEKKSSWQHGHEVLAQLGFQLEDVNLKLSPAMLEVVLRDVPGLLSPADACKQRTEKALLLTELQDIRDKAPASAQGKKAALKLTTEKRLDNRSKELRQFLEGLLSSEEATRADLEVFTCQINDLTARLESAEALVKAERNQREMSDSITASAEKRIQELEELLVDVETKAADTLKQKRKVTQLQSRIKEFDEELKSAAVEVIKEREKQEQAIAEVCTAHEQIALLENQREETEKFFANIQTQLADEKAEKLQLKEKLQEAELRIEVLDTDLENAERKADQHDESAKMAESVQTQLTELRQQMKKTLNLNIALEEKLAAANGEKEGLKESLKTAELRVKALGTDLENAEKKAALHDEEQTTFLAEQNEQLGRELKDLRDKYDQECSIRTRLEKDVVKEAKRIEELENSLHKASQNTSVVKDPEEGARELASLRIELQELNQRFKAEQQSREELDSELGEAHKLIDSFEKMLLETEEATREQHSHDMSKESEGRKIQELTEKLKTVEAQLEQELIEQKRLTKVLSLAEKKLTEQEGMLVQGQAEQLERKAQETVVAEAVTQHPVKPTKPLPHELRPAPKKGALFCPDWDLAGLPCRSSGQVFKAWEAVFNVQISLEGYPSQYCMAFLVVVQLETQKKLYMLYRLKLNKHTLICVPVKAPKDETALQKNIKDGLNFLKMSGFEMDEMAAENIDSTLSTYFQKG